MSYFIGVIANEAVSTGGTTLEASMTGQIWKIQSDTAERIDVTPSDLNVHRADHGEDALSTLRKRFPGVIFHKLELAPGEYYPGMVRPKSTNPTETLGYNPDKTKKSADARATNAGQMQALIDQLEQICRVVHPEKNNLEQTDMIF